MLGTFSFGMLIYWFGKTGKVNLHVTGGDKGDEMRRCSACTISMQRCVLSPLFCDIFSIGQL